MDAPRQGLSEIIEHFESTRDSIFGRLPPTKPTVPQILLAQLKPSEGQGSYVSKCKFQLKNH